MITIDITMWIHIFNTLILIVVLNAVLYRPVRKILAERKQKLAELNNEIETFHSNAKQRAEEFDEKFREARRKAKSEFDSARSEAQAVGADKLQQIREESDKVKAEQLTQVSSEVAAAEKALKDQVDAFAGEMATKVLGRAV
ncbi:MAG: ATP synthase F0 subunit B [Desulfobulbaceae bacterium]|uniref:ATP synthase subunit b n=1 Tax=Candidatus Desulfobia pelagia TaxID=2841692 RepID=A0A8J6TER9_9BACT|nr:ATP synthase F0 subunit B [Candidatus Desulfobia pelagia]